MKQWFRFMIRSIFLFLIFLLNEPFAQSASPPDTTVPAPTPASPSSPDAQRIAALQSRFRGGVLLENEGKLDEALEVFQGIIKEAPGARGSLYYAALVSMRLGNLTAGLNYVEKFRALEPKDFKGIVLSIQINQALQREEKVETLRSELLARRGSGNIAGLSDTSCYHREWIPGKDLLTVVDEFFDYQTNPKFVFYAEQRSSSSELIRKLMIAFNPDETRSMRSKSSKYANMEVFDFCEEVIRNGKSVQINVYRQDYEKPSYPVARKWFIDTLKQAPVPISTRPTE